jgi:hypothetical protein
MTIKELYDWAIKNGVENFEIRLVENEDGDYCGEYWYFGVDDINIDTEWNEVVI